MDRRPHRQVLVAAAAALAATWLAGFSAVHAQTVMDPLPSWEEGEARSAILDFVASVTTEGSSDYVEPNDRIAVFDNDGTLWVEQPVYTQGVFLLDRLRALAKDDPTLAQTPDLAAVLKDDFAALTSLSETDVAKLISLTGVKMTSDAYRGVARQWLATARHKRWDRPYTELVYQPMIEMMRYLRSSGFTVFIVSGGGTAFIRAYADRTYGVHPDNVVGSTIRLKYETVDGKPELVRLPDLDRIDDGPGKAVGIGMYIGKRPVIAFGNSDGDFEMLEFTTAGEGRRLGLIVHHDDADREYAYDRESKIGHLDRALDAAPQMGWLLVSMRDDWGTVFAWEQ